MNHLGWGCAFIAANVAVAAGHLSVTVLVLPDLLLGRGVRLFGTGLFVGTALTYLWLMTAHPYAGPVWVWIHATTAVCTWGLIAAFRLRIHTIRRRHARTG